jgi:hypothetical protein
MLRRRGYTEDDAPQELLDAVNGEIQAVLQRDSAFLHVAQSGGPATLRGRRRAAFNIWRDANESALRCLHELRQWENAAPKRVTTFEAAIAAEPEAR